MADDEYLPEESDAEHEDILDAHNLDDTSPSSEAHAHSHQAKRVMVTRKLTQILNADLAEKLEEELFRQAQGVFKKEREHCLDIVYNLEANEELRQKVLSGDITLEKLACMRSEELATPELQHERLEAMVKYQSEVITDKKIVGFVRTVDVDRYVKEADDEEVQLEKINDPIASAPTTTLLTEDEEKELTNATLKIVENEEGSSDPSHSMAVKDDVGEMKENLEHHNIHIQAQNHHHHHMPHDHEKAPKSRSRRSSIRDSKALETLCNRIKELPLPESAIWEGSVFWNNEMQPVRVEILQRGGLSLPHLPLGSSTIHFDREIAFAKLKKYSHEVWSVSSSKKLALLAINADIRSPDADEAVNLAIDNIGRKRQRAFVHKAKDSDLTVYIIPGAAETSFPAGFLRSLFNVERPMTKLWGIVIFGIQALSTAHPTLVSDTIDPVKREEIELAMPKKKPIHTNQDWLPQNHELKTEKNYHEEQLLAKNSHLNSAPVNGRTHVPPHNPGPPVQGHADYHNRPHPHPHSHHHSHPPPQGGNDPQFQGYQQEFDSGMSQDSGYYQQQVSGYEHRHTPETMTVSMYSSRRRNPEELRTNRGGPQGYQSGHHRQGYGRSGSHSHEGYHGRQQMQNPRGYGDRQSGGGGGGYRNSPHRGHHPHQQQRGRDYRGQKDRRGESPFEHRERPHYARDHSPRGPQRGYQGPNRGHTYGGNKRQQGRGDYGHEAPVKRSRFNDGPDRRSRWDNAPH